MGYLEGHGMNRRTVVDRSERINLDGFVAGIRTGELSQGFCSSYSEYITTSQSQVIRIKQYINVKHIKQGQNHAVNHSSHVLYMVVRLHGHGLLHCKVIRVM